MRCHTLARHAAVGHLKEPPLEMLILVRCVLVEYKERLTLNALVIVEEHATRVYPRPVIIDAVVA
jgi:hypothetical protein